MNRYERVVGASRMIARGIAIGVGRRIEEARGKEPTRILHSLAYSYYAEQMGIQKGSEKERQIKIVIPPITDYWFNADAVLDNDTTDAQLISLDGVLDRRNGVLDKNTGVVSEGIKRAIQEIEFVNRKKAYEAHKSFMEDFDPNTSSYEEVMAYRKNTTGLFADTIVKAIAIVAETAEDISPLLQRAGTESICFQIADDLVDCVFDFRKEVPNLFNALLLEFPSERDRFANAISSPAFLRNNRPSGIAKKYAPKTLDECMRRYNSLAETLPWQRRKIARDGLALVFYLGSTPNGSKSTISFSDGFNSLRKRTPVE